MLTTTCPGCGDVFTMDVEEADAQGVPRTQQLLDTLEWALQHKTHLDQWLAAQKDAPRA